MRVAVVITFVIFACQMLTLNMLSLAYGGWRVTGKPPSLHCITANCSGRLRYNESSAQALLDGKVVNPAWSSQEPEHGTFNLKPSPTATPSHGAHFDNDYDERGGADGKTTVGWMTRVACAPWRVHCCCFWKWDADSEKLRPILC